eukprot:COSAG02_NODE_6711_length_3406_cov_28.065921_1_plen_162_part_00
MDHIETPSVCHTRNNETRELLVDAPNAHSCLNSCEHCCRSNHRTFPSSHNSVLHCSLDSTHRQLSVACTMHHALQEYALATYLQNRPELMQRANSNTSEHCCSSSHRAHSTDTLTTSLQPGQHARPALSHVCYTPCAAGIRTRDVPAVAPWPDAHSRLRHF